MNHAARVFGWGVCLLVLLAAGQAGADVLIFQDDFNRPDGPKLGNAWQPNHTLQACMPAEPGAARGGPAKPAKVFPKVSLRENRLLFSDSHSRESLTVVRQFNRLLTRVEYDLVPIHVMGGPDDRARAGVRVQFLDVNGSILGEVGDFHYSAAFGAFTNTRTTHWRATRVPFNMGLFHGIVNVDELLETFLPGVDRERIHTTRVILELFAGWCGSEVEAAFDNVRVFAASNPLLPFTPEEMVTLVASCRGHHQRSPKDFPGNWLRHVDFQYGQKRVAEWRQAAREHVGKDPARLVDLARAMSQDTGQTGPDYTWDALLAVSLLLFVD
ncbi:MAG: hypothetical protein HQL82_12260 [Magnetococcales bacterium]|nr:hypothetical protein [Magnetococcales bacterium]